MRNLKQQKGFTLIELIITVTIFSVFMISLVVLTIDLYRNSRRIQLQEQLFQDMRAMMRQVTILIEDNAIDYEEYYRASVGDEVLANLDGSGSYTYGDYGKQFYNFGSGGPGPSGEGVWCNDGVTEPEDDPGCVIDRTSLDRNTGQNPANADPGSANAFCGGAAQIECLTSDQDFLFLINERGDRKQILASELVNRDVNGTNEVETVLSTMWLTGTDTDGDDIVDTWNYAPEFNMSGNPLDELRAAKDEVSVYDNFIPISPLRTNITNLKFHINPLEDPYKAFSETDPATGTLVQPHVTVVMTAQPSKAELTNYLGAIPTKTLQTTIYSDIKNDVRSY